MFFYAAFFVALRTFVQIVCDDYASKSGVCQNLLKKAFAETLPDIRSAYFLKVMEADNKAVSDTFKNFYIGFLASNTTYASEDEIVQNACKMPSITLEFLSWTSGVIPLFAVYVFYLFAKNLWKRFKRKPITVVKVKEKELEMTEPPRDTPPRSPLYVPRDVEPLQQVVEKPRHPGIRRRKDKSRERERGRPRERTPAEPSVMEKMRALSPSLRDRIMNDDPIV
tara:strand:- start:50 stop:721 length:672 start_codon:yes stop_codon:yes gene_type:complete